MRANLFILAILGSVAFTAAASAQTTLGEFNKWSAYAFNDSDGKMCVASSEPIASKYSQPIKGRDSVLFLITRFPDEKVDNEPSTVIGYPFATDAKVTIEIDGKSEFTMFTDDDLAWLADEHDSTVVDAMRKGSQMIVEGTSRRGTVTKDTYSLAGVTAAIAAITKECP